MGSITSLFIHERVASSLADPALNTEVVSWNSKKSSNRFPLDIGTLFPKALQREFIQMGDER
jgi:hypothetical protein